MIRMLVIYEQPADVAAFDDHYFNVHVPLAKRLAGLRRYAVSRNPAALRGPKPYLIAELDWDDATSLRTDFASQLGRETASDVDRLATLCPSIRSTLIELEIL